MLIESICLTSGRNSNRDQTGRNNFFQQDVSIHIHVFLPFLCKEATFCIFLFVFLDNVPYYLFKSILYRRNAVALFKNGISSKRKERETMF